jgi:hypothetical protein
MVGLCGNFHEASTRRSLTQGTIAKQSSTYSLTKQNVLSQKLHITMFGGKSTSVSTYQRRLILRSSSPTLCRRAQAARGPRLADCLRRSRDLRSALPLYVLGEPPVVWCEMMRKIKNVLTEDPSAFCRRIRFQACVSDIRSFTENQRIWGCHGENRRCTNTQAQ